MADRPQHDRPPLDTPEWMRGASFDVAEDLKRIAEKYPRQIEMRDGRLRVVAPQGTK